MLFTKNYLLVLVIGLIAVMALTAACAAQAPEAPASSGDEQEIEQGSNDEDTVEQNNDEEHAAEHDSDEEHEHDGEATIPNNGAVVRIMAPADGAVFKVGDDIVVEIVAENFVLGEDGNHWHVFVDDQSFGMIVGGDLDQVVRGLEPGEHEISAYLSNGEHQELEDGAQITITVE